MDRLGIIPIISIVVVSPKISAIAPSGAVITPPKPKANPIIIELAIPLEWGAALCAIAFVIGSVAVSMAYPTMKRRID
jgi:hypothetical protein